MTPLWIDNFDILYEKKYLFEIVPSKNFDFNRKLNSLLRLSIYYSIVVYMLNKNTKILLTPILVGAFTVIMGKNLKKNIIDKAVVDLQNNTEKPLEKIDIDCRIPTENNPFMNPTVFGENNNKSSCLSYNNKGIQRNIENNFNTNLNREASDIFGKNNSQRQFYTVPSKKYPNDQDAFKKWLYSTPPTCKEGNGLQCAANGYGTAGGGSSPS
jgi:hypothetical protein